VGFACRSNAPYRPSRFALGSVRRLAAAAIVIAAHDDFDALSLTRPGDAIDETVLAADAAGPPAAQIAVQRFGLADADKAAAPDVGNQRVDSS